MSTESGGIGDMIAIGVAIGALVVSSFTYRRNRKSEQIKIAREITDRIEQKRYRLWLKDYAIKSLDKTNMNYDTFRDWLWHIGGTLYELEYFTHLAKDTK